MMEHKQSPVSFDQSNLMDNLPSIGDGNGEYCFIFLNSYLTEWNIINLISFVLKFNRSYIRNKKLLSCTLVVQN